MARRFPSFPDDDEVQLLAGGIYNTKSKLEYYKELLEKFESLEINPTLKISSELEFRVFEVDRGRYKKRSDDFGLEGIVRKMLLRKKENLEKRLENLSGQLRSAVLR